MSTLKDINETLAMISEGARHVYSLAEAYSASSYITQWLDQLNREIEKCEEEEN